MKKPAINLRNIPKPPAKLSAESKVWWKKLVAEFELDDAGLMVLESALEAHDRVRQAQALIAKDGPVTEDRWGQKKMHPAVLIERDSKALVARLLKQLNLDLEPLQSPGRPAGR
jgi:P27 family predicted phage terminase small subunit